MQIKLSLSLSSATEGATIRYTIDGSTPSESTGLIYTQPIVITSNVTIKAIAVKEGLSNSEIAVFEYTLDNGTKIDQPANQKVTAFIYNQVLHIRGLDPGEIYTVYSILGNIVVQGKITDKVEQQTSFPYKGIFVVATPKTKVKILAE